MQNHTSSKRVRRSSDNLEGLLPWKLHPIDFEKSSVREAGNKPPERPTGVLYPTSCRFKQTSSQKPAAAGLDIDSIRVELTAKTFDDLKSIVSKISSDDNVSDGEKKTLDLQGTSSSSSPIAEKPVFLDNDVKLKEMSCKNLENDQSKIATDEDMAELIDLIRNFPHIYDQNDSYYRNTKRKEISWNVISSMLGISVSDCQSKWKLLRTKYCRERKHLADGDQLSEKNMTFVNSMNFLAYKKRNPYKRRKVSEDTAAPDESQDLENLSTSSSTNLINSCQPKIIDENQLYTRRPRPLYPQSPFPISDIETPDKIAREKIERFKNGSEIEMKPDQLFADEIVFELQRLPIHHKNLIKAKIWQVLAEFGNRI